MEDATLDNLLTDTGEPTRSFSRAVALTQLALGGRRGTSEVPVSRYRDLANRPGFPEREAAGSVAGHRLLVRDSGVAAAIRRTKRRLPVRLLGVAAAAVVIAVALPGLPEVENAHRSDAFNSSARVELGTPMLETGNVVFNWATVPYASVYEVTIYDDTGSLLVDRTTSDTTTTVSAGELPSGASAFWRVRARVEAGRWTESMLDEFEVDGLRP
jgi:hypothetical protein